MVVAREKKGVVMSGWQDWMPVVGIYRLARARGRNQGLEEIQGNAMYKALAFAVTHGVSISVLAFLVCYGAWRLLGGR